MTTVRQPRRLHKPKFDLLWRLMADTTLLPPAKNVAAVLLLKFHNTKTGQCNPSLAAIGESAGRSRRSIIRDVAELEESGWITIESTKGGSSANTNRFKFDFERMSSSARSGKASANPGQRTDDTDANDEERGQTSPPEEPDDCADEQSRDAHVEQGQYTEIVDQITAGPVSGVTPSSGATPDTGDTGGQRGDTVGTRTKKNHSLLRSEGEGGESSAACGFAAPLKKEEHDAKFEELCQIWFRPYGTNKAKAAKAYLAVCTEHGDRIRTEHGGEIADLLLASARNWTTKKAARWIPKLEEWLENGAWQNEPESDKGARPSANDDAVADMLRQGGV